MTLARRPVASRRGYTFVELLMSLSILTIGMGGIVAMQKVTLSSSRHARNLATATQVSQAWLEELRADTEAWNYPSANQRTQNDLADGHWLTALASSTGTTTDWFLPTYQSGRRFGPGFDIQGRPVDTDVSANRPRVRFCTHIRLSWIYRSTGSGIANQGTTVGNGLIRAEVRTFWPRDGQSEHVPGNLCGGNVVTVGAATDRYHFVYQVSALRQNTAP